MTNYPNNEFLVASEAGTGYFFVEVLNKKILETIKQICRSLGFHDFRIHGYITTVEDSHFEKIEAR